MNADALAGLSDYLRYLSALAVVLALLAACAWLLRRFGLGALAGVVAGVALPGGPGRSRRLALVEVLPLDPRYRLVLVRRDQAEYLLLLGPTGASVIEPGTGPADGSAPPAGPST